MTRKLDGEYAAVIDRIVEGRAVLLVEDDGKAIEERTLASECLPPEAAEGDVCTARFEQGDVRSIERDPETTAERRSRLKERFDRLSRRLGEDGDPFERE